MKYYLDNLVVEVTRRCNMNCQHCLRGESENIDIDFKYIDSLLENISGIGNVTFSGGEPSLNVPAIEYMLQRCKEKSIPVCGFYIVTNAKSNPIPLAMAALKWYAYCEPDDGMCGICISKDMFHDEIDPAHEYILRGLSFFTEDKSTDFNRTKIVSEGRGEALSGFNKILLEDMHDEFSAELWDDDEYRIDSMVYLSANGDVRTDCNAAYSNKEYTIGNLKNDPLNYILQLQIIEQTKTLPI